MPQIAVRKSCANRSLQQQWRKSQLTTNSKITGNHSYDKNNIKSNEIIKF